MKKFKTAAITTACLAGATFAGSFKLFDFALKRRKDQEQSLDDLVKKGEEGEEDSDKEPDPFARAIKDARPWFDAQPYEIVQVESFDGLKLKARIMLNSQPTDKFVIAVHGYRSYGIREYIAYAKFFMEQGFSLILPDDRCHGQSEGTYIGMGYLDHFDCMKWIDYVVERFGSQSKIMLYGISMGAATVMITQGEELPSQVKCVVEDCGYASVEEEFAHNLRTLFPVKLPKFPLYYLTDRICKNRAGYEFRQVSPIDGVRKTKLPTLFIHGGSDDFVPTKMVYDLYCACNAPRRLLVIPDAPHAGSHLVDPQKYEKAVADFAKQYCR